MMPDAKKVLSRLRDERGLGDRQTLAREAAELIEALQNRLAEKDKLIADIFASGDLH